MKVIVNLPYKSEIEIECEKEETVLELHQKIVSTEGIPLKNQILRMPHTKDLLINRYEDTLGVVYNEGNYKGDTILLDLLIDLDGGAGAYFNCNDFDPTIKILCCTCGCVKEWKSQQLCCMKCGCTIQ